MLYNWADWYTDAIKIAGMDNKKAIFTESSLLKFANRAAVITMPDLETPGMIASVCIKPIKIIMYTLIDSKLLYWTFFLISAMYKITAKIIVIKAIELIDRKFIDIKSINSRATIGRGMEATIISLM